jgi:hypothetical protein
MTGSGLAAVVDTLVARVNLTAALVAAYIAAREGVVVCANEPDACRAECISICRFKLTV